MEGVKVSKRIVVSKQMQQPDICKQYQARLVDLVNLEESWDQG